MDIPQHRHCQMCGKAIPLDERFCSEECREKYVEFLKKRRRLILIMYVILFIVLAIALVTIFYT
ncbi:MAG: DUF2116 family Zn-ribbon domain-containing protein [Thermoplasmata archaeon]|nr:MAG: DUF2116 family Zn-ribbon domain-containing protein [Thermoplasmata archaeon]RLF39890.1 MAG: DUF2116 family Zn-ribbon domain-containing protein [Thermoplasmata archaeon]